MTINYTSGNDIIVPTNNTTYRGLDGDDIYIISKATSINSSITIIDTKGLNIIQLIDGLINNSVAVGCAALGKLTTGIDNTALGKSSGGNLTSGSNNIIIGTSAQPSSN